MSTLLESILPDEKRSIVSIRPDISIAQCVELMVQENIGAVVVTDEDNLLGVVSERDIVRLLVHKGLSPESTKVSDVLCADVSVLKLSDTVETAMEVMTATKRRHILVSDEDALVAVISVGDLLFNMLDDKSKTIEQLQNYIHTY